jgi:hypothetical protein
MAATNFVVLVGLFSCVSALMLKMVKPGSLVGSPWRRIVAAFWLVLAGPLAVWADTGPACVFSPGERLAALESLAGALRGYITDGGAYPASLRLLPAGTLREIPVQLGDDALWLWPPATAPLGDDVRLMQGNYVSASCMAPAADCAGVVRSVCYVLIDGAGAFCTAAETLDSPGACSEP